MDFKFVINTNIFLMWLTVNRRGNSAENLFAPPLFSQQKSSVSKNVTGVCAVKVAFAE